MLVMCAPKDFTSASVVDTLRVLAVRADRPLAEPGETVALEALVADPRGAGRNVYFAYATCINPGSGEIAACAEHLGAFHSTLVDPDGHASFSLTVPSNALASAPIGEVGIVFAACAGSFVDSPRQPGAPI